MLSNRATKLATTKSKVVTLTGGLNEQITNTELRPGELISCKNYVELDDKYHGYQSIRGYERFDGQSLASSVSASTSILPALGVWKDDLLWKDTQLWSDLLDTDTDENISTKERETQRNSISKVPGEALKGISGIHIYKNKVYALRNNAAGTFTSLYVESTSGWLEIDTSSFPISIGGTSRFSNYRFSKYNNNHETMFWVDGVSQPHVFDGTTVTEIDMTSVVGANIYPNRIGTWKNRLFLVYPDGHIIFSEVGDPTGYDSASGLAGEIFVGDTITGIKEAPGGALNIFTNNTIKILNYGSTTGDFIFSLDEFSNSAGALPDTVQNLLGTLYFTDDQGFSSLSTVAEYGDFAAKNIGKNVQRTFLANKHNMAWSVVDRDSNRFFQFYINAVTGKTSALVYTFVVNARGTFLKGATRIDLLIKVDVAVAGKVNGENLIFLGSSDGFVYKFQSGTSFDGSVIDTEFITSYYSYGTPRNWKRFKRLEFEITAENNTTIYALPSFNYASSEFDLSATEKLLIKGLGSVYGDSIYGESNYGGALLDKGTLNIQGVGTTMATKLSSSSLLKKPHTIHNMLVDYTTGSIER